jgi:hypothetical protein
MPETADTARGYLRTDRGFLYSEAGVWPRVKLRPISRKQSVFKSPFLEIEKRAATAHGKFVLICETAARESATANHCCVPTETRSVGTVRTIEPEGLRAQRRVFRV